MAEVIPFCCQLFSHALGSDKIRLQTHKNCGEWVYGISADGGKTTLLQIDYCPFCGTKLEGGLPSMLQASAREQLEKIAKLLNTEISCSPDGTIMLRPEPPQFPPSAASS